MPITKALVEDTIQRVNVIADPGQRPQNPANMDNWRQERIRFVGDVYQAMDRLIQANNGAVPPELANFVNSDGSPRAGTLQDIKDGLNDLLARTPNGGRRRRVTRRRGNRTRKSRRTGRGQTR